MQKYEMLILLKSDMDDEAKDAELKKYADIIASKGGAVESTDKWGVKKTAYPIAYMTVGANGETVKELDRVAGISSDVLRRVITKVKEN